MRTVYFSEVMHTALQLCGLDRALTTPDRFAMVRDFASMRLRSIWEMNEWTDLMAISRCSTTNTPSDNPSNNGFLNKAGRRLVNLPVGVGQVITIWNRDPVAQNSVQKDFDIVGDDVFLKNDTDSDVYVESRLDCPRLFGDSWSTSVTYRKGSQVYYDAGSESGALTPVNGYATQGDFYEYTGETPSGTGSIPTIGSWGRVKIPKLFANALIHGVHADFRRSTNELEAAQSAEADCQKAIDAALDQTLRQQGSTRPINFRGY
jgi:hypothetical protein